MAHEYIATVIDELDDLLDAERTALLAGNLDEVKRLFERKTNLVETLSRLESAETAGFAELRHKVERNQDLLQSATEGVKSVARRLSAIRRVRESLETYDARGRRKKVDVKTTTTLEKRA
ncbi:flagellar biosynthesis protein FlgN [Tateyamaria sp. syn59]|uniref:flagellar biosynthesis protein FlgN n=1 Tax=Tateyamaria sp. syn59 TaxID=2576942 RepID=UPI001CB8AED1|nr:flagellar biosynthesis protein FlgN [Tateyamaria sp. syn59]